MKNISASVRHQLYSLAKKDQRPFSELLQYYAMERFLFRLSKSKYKHHFILKGALMLTVWEASECRPTMDIDMLGRASNLEEDAKKQINEILTTEVINDGIQFNVNTITTEPITENATYIGTRIRFLGFIALNPETIHHKILLKAYIYLKFHAIHHYA